MHEGFCMRDAAALCAYAAHETRLNDASRTLQFWWVDYCLACCACVILWTACEWRDCCRTLELTVMGWVSGRITDKHAQAPNGCNYTLV